MSLFDTLDGVLIGRAYRRPVTDEGHRARHVAIMTAVAAAVALTVGTFEAAQLLPGLSAALSPSLTEGQSQLGGIAVTAVLVSVWVGYGVRRPAMIRPGGRRVTEHVRS